MGKKKQVEEPRLQINIAELNINISNKTGVSISDIMRGLTHLVNPLLGETRSQLTGCGGGRRWSTPYDGKLDPGETAAPITPKTSEIPSVEGAGEPASEDIGPGADTLRDDPSPTATTVVDSGGSEEIDGTEPTHDEPDTATGGTSTSSDGPCADELRDDLPATVAPAREGDDAGRSGD